MVIYQSPCQPSEFMTSAQLKYNLLHGQRNLDRQKEMMKVANGGVYNIHDK